MLVLTRRVGEEIVIGDTIHVTLLAAQKDKVRLGITAPPVVRVDREEIHLRRQEGRNELRRRRLRSRSAAHALAPAAAT